MTGGFRLPAHRARPMAGAPAQVWAFVARTWRGRILFATAALLAVHVVGLPLPHSVLVAGRLVLAILGGWEIFRFGLSALRGLLWRIRTKLILSYLFVGLVPVILLTLFFLVAGLIFVNLVASHLVMGEMQELRATLLTLARSCLFRLPTDDRAAGAAFSERLGLARQGRAPLAHTLVRKGRILDSAGNAPRSLPQWWTGDEFAGLAGEEGKPDVFRVVCREADATVLIDVPVDTSLFTDLERRTGIQVLEGSELEVRGRGPARHAPLVEVEGSTGGRGRLEGRASPGINGVALPDRVDWATGQGAPRALVFRFNPLDLFRRLAPGLGGAEPRSLADILVYALSALGLVFLVMYAVALVLGLVLARSITRSVHALSRGTERLRRGDFSQSIPVTSHDQLGELAESFNHMARGIQVLLREQAEKERLEEELRIARAIQMSLLPREGAVTVPGLRVAALCTPAAEVGGDYYDLLPLSGTRLGVLVADVSGKGTSAALYMAELKGLVLSLSRIHDSPARLLAEANCILAANMDSRSFITMTYAVVDVGTRKMRFARAGHSPIIQLEAATGETRVLTPPGLGLGLDRGPRFEQIMEEAEVPLHSGDVFLFFTDGLSEAMNAEAELFGEGRLRRIMEESRALGSEGIRERILGEIRDFAAGAPPADDMTLVLFKVA
jgi:serine phosphatase RsbU (regulator of sigma subunit)